MHPPHPLPRRLMRVIQPNRLPRVTLPRRLVWAAPPLLAVLVAARAADAVEPPTEPPQPLPAPVIPTPPPEAGAQPGDETEPNADTVPPPTPPPAGDAPSPPAAPSRPAGKPPADAPPEAPGPAAPTRTVPGKYIEEEPIEPGPELLPVGTDTLGGHFQLGAAAAWAVPFGSIESGQSQGDLFATGSAFSLDLGLGISRTTVLGLEGDFGLLAADPDCDGCEAQSFGLGGFLRYHLVQGLSFDPWMSAGMGYRQTSLDGGPSFAGLDWAKLRLGGDWYPLDNLGFGPVVGLTLTSFLSRSEGDFAGTSVAARFTLGGRIVFDAPGK